MTRIILHGCSGGMGTAVRQAAAEHGALIVAGIAKEGDRVNDTFPVFTRVADCDIMADVIIDFSIADAVGPLMRYSAKNRLPVVVCTTGLSAQQENEVISAARFTAVFRSDNMSLGISLLSAVLRRISGILYETGFDIELVEKHHNRKIDAPSGTALRLAETINAAVGGVLQPVYDRSNTRERRGRTEIGVSSIRGGTVSGEHSVIFAGKDEVIELKHTAISRQIYAVGALKAAEFIRGKPNGFYTMESLMDMGEL